MSSVRIPTSWHDHSSFVSPDTSTTMSPPHISNGNNDKILGASLRELNTVKRNRIIENPTQYQENNNLTEIVESPSKNQPEPDKSVNDIQIIEKKNNNPSLE